MAMERKKGLPTTSLQQIKFVGPVHEGKFKKSGVATTTELISKMRVKTAAEIAVFLKKIGLESRAYNSTIIFLYRHGNANIPACKKL